MRKRDEKQQWVHRGHSRRIRLWLAVLLSCMLVFALAVLIRYGLDLIGARKTEAKLKEAYYNVEAESFPAEEKTAETEDPPPDVTAAPGLAAEEATLPDETPEPGNEEGAGAPHAKLEPVAYPNNPQRKVSARFKVLREKNRDIIGWLKMDNLLEEAVVQRDNTYYMRHDAMKQENVNGAIFLDAAVSLKTRPYTLLVYGHNMKSGAMFGCLRNYENMAYYKKSPFFSFESLYEEGRYVVFAAGSIGLEEEQEHYIDVFMMLSDRPDERQAVIDGIRNASVFSCGVDVVPEDQLLLLVTCVDDDNRRRVVAGRRIRDGEKEADLLAQIGKSTQANKR